MNDSPPVPPGGENPKFDQWAEYWSEQLQRLGTHQGAYSRTRVSLTTHTQTNTVNSPAFDTMTPAQLFARSTRLEGRLEYLRSQRRGGGFMARIIRKHIKATREALNPSL